MPTTFLIHDKHGYAYKLIDISEERFFHALLWDGNKPVGEPNCVI
jgi:hypothetical protein